ncbi:MAG TPA: FtsK/SpoIIIE domain-containing protein [Acidimicrobiales bacterium]|nr:FtsK/SpoIIIE domain-containing protein [Acidimicrobiales bacterium]
MVANQIGLQGTRVTAVTETALGHAVELQLQPPNSVVRIGMMADQLAVAFGIARVRVLADPLHSHRVTVLLDQQLSIGSVPYRAEHNPVGKPLDPLRVMPIGLDDNGDEVAASFYGQSILIGGNPGSGKSVAMRVILAGLGASNNVCLVGIDPKHAELSMWRPRFTRLVLGNEVEPTVELLNELLSEVQRRAEYLATTQTATLQPTNEYPWIVLVIDEWAELGAAGDVKQRTSINALLRRYLSLGRAVGCTALLCAQRPTSDSVDVGTRALTTHRFALKCGDRHQAEAILGVGAFVPEQLLSAIPGRALWSDGGPAKAVQLFNLIDEQVPSLLYPPLRPRTSPLTAN